MMPCVGPRYALGLFLLDRRLASATVSFQVVQADTCLTTEQGHMTHPEQMGLEAEHAFGWLAPARMHFC